MKKRLILLCIFILTAAFSVEVFAGEAKMNFGVKKREKKVQEQRLSQAKVKAAPVKKTPLIQPLAETTVAATTAVVGATKNITDSMYSQIVNDLAAKIGKTKSDQPAGEKVQMAAPATQKKAARVSEQKRVEQPARMKYAEKTKATIKTTGTSINKVRAKKEVEPARRQREDFSAIK